jgi:hypothetical protein
MTGIEAVMAASNSDRKSIAEIAVEALIGMAPASRAATWFDGLPRVICYLMLPVLLATFAMLLAGHRIEREL